MESCSRFVVKELKLSFKEATRCFVIITTTLLEWRINLDVGSRISQSFQQYSRTENGQVEVCSTNLPMAPGGNC